jgi:hypothetical protein
MGIPGFTAENTLGRKSGYYYRNSATVGSTNGLVAAFVAPTACRLSTCFTVGSCRTRVRCCRDFRGSCTCTAVPCSFLGPPDTES